MHTSFRSLHVILYMTLFIGLNHIKCSVAGWRELDAPLPGRLTGSASIDTLVRVGLEKERGGPRARMLVLSDFVPCVEDELAVKRGDHVQVKMQ